MSTYTTTRAQVTLVTLVRNPGPEQRALRVCEARRDDHRTRALALARRAYGDDADLGWLCHQTGVVSPA